MGVAMFTYDGLIEFDRTVKLAEKGDKKAIHLCREVIKALADEIPHEEVAGVGRIFVTHISNHSQRFLCHV